MYLGSSLELIVDYIALYNFQHFVFMESLLVCV